MLFWTFLYAILFVAVFGGLLGTMAYLALGIWNKDRSTIKFGLRVLLFTIFTGTVFYLLMLRETGLFFEKIKDILDSL